MKGTITNHVWVNYGKLSNNRHSPELPAMIPMPLL